MLKKRKIRRKVQLLVVEEGKEGTEDLEIK
jgi:hypothetical protein